VTPSCNYRRIKFHFASVVGLFPLTSDTAIYFLDYFLNKIAIVSLEYGLRKS